MKKFAILLFCVATLGLASCKKEVYVPDPVTAKTYNFTIRVDDWVKNADGSFSVTKPNNAFDAITLRDEGILVYFQHPADKNGDIQLPYTFNYSAFSYEIYDGGITFDVQDTNNLSNSVKPTYDTLVKVVIVPSTYAN